MGRKIIILTTLLGLLIGTVGLPMNVHACKMAKSEQVAKTCGMCVASHEKQSDDGNGCCDNRVELQHTDHASLVKTTVEVPAPIIIAVLVWPLLQSESIVDLHHTNLSQTHPPPLERRNQSTYLFNSSFLI